MMERLGSRWAGALRDEGLLNPPSNTLPPAPAVAGGGPTAEGRPSPATPASASSRIKTEALSSCPGSLYSCCC